MAEHEQVCATDVHIRAVRKFLARSTPTAVDDSLKACLLAAANRAMNEAGQTTIVLDHYAQLPCVDSTAGMAVLRSRLWTVVFPFGTNCETCTAAWNSCARSAPRACGCGTAIAS